MSRRTSVYLPDELDAAVRASGKSVPELIRAGLASLNPPTVPHDCAGDRLVRLLREQGYRIVPPADASL
jgi:hypothetical protein